MSIKNDRIGKAAHILGITFDELESALVSYEAAKAPAADQPDERGAEISTAAQETGASRTGRDGESEDYVRDDRTAVQKTRQPDERTALAQDVEEYLHWRKVNPQIKGGENYLKRFRQSLAALERKAQQPDELPAASVIRRIFLEGCGCGRYPHEEDPEAFEEIWNVSEAKAIADTLPEREIRYRAGDAVPSKDPDFGELVAIPREQIEDIYRTLGQIVQKSQYTVGEAMDAEKSDIVRFKGDVFCLAESAQLFAGNWVQRRRG